MRPRLLSPGPSLAGRLGRGVLVLVLGQRRETWGRLGVGWDRLRLLLPNHDVDFGPRRGKGVKSKRSWRVRRTELGPGPSCKGLKLSSRTGTASPCKRSTIYSAPTRSSPPSLSSSSKTFSITHHSPPSLHPLLSPLSHPHPRNFPSWLSPTESTETATSRPTRCSSPALEAGSAVS